MLSPIHRARARSARPKLHTLSINRKIKSEICKEVYALQH